MPRATSCQGSDSNSQQREWRLVKVLGDVAVVEARQKLRATQDLCGCAWGEQQYQSSWAERRGQHQAGAAKVTCKQRARQS
jgi:hypothetical protein